MHRLAPIWSCLLVVMNVCLLYMEVSSNRGTPQSSIYRWDFPLKTIQRSRGTPISGNPHIIFAIFLPIPWDFPSNHEVLGLLFGANGPICTSAVPRSCNQVNVGNRLQCSEVQNSKMVKWNMVNRWEFPVDLRREFLIESLMFDVTTGLCGFQNFHVPTRYKNCNSCWTSWPVGCDRKKRKTGSFQVNVELKQKEIWGCP